MYLGLKAHIDKYVVTLESNCDNYVVRVRVRYVSYICWLLKLDSHIEVVRNIIIYVVYILMMEIRFRQFCR